MSQSRPVTLFDLPAEIRNEIYHHTLVPEDTIVISRRRGTIAAKRRYFTTRHTDSTTRHFAVSFLRVSTLSNREAAPVFYGNNTFHFSNSDHFTEWMRAIRGSNAQAVRLVRLQYVSMCHDFFLKPLIAHTPNLTRLEVPYNKHYSAKRLAGDLVNFVRGLCEHSGKGREAKDMLDVLAIYDTDGTTRATIYETGGEHAAYEQDVKEELAKILS